MPCWLIVDAILRAAAGFSSGFPRSIQDNPLLTALTDAAVCSSAASTTAALSSAGVLGPSGSLACDRSGFCASPLPSCLGGACGSSCGVPNVAGYALLEATLGVDFGGQNISFASGVATPEQCAMRCSAEPLCFAFYYDFRGQTCALKRSGGASGGTAGNSSRRAAAARGGGGFFVPILPGHLVPSTGFAFPEAASTLFSTSTPRITLRDCAKACVDQGSECAGIAFDATQAVSQCKGIRVGGRGTAAAAGGGAPTSGVSSSAAGGAATPSLVLSYERIPPDVPNPAPPPPPPPRPSSPPLPPGPPPPQLQPSPPPQPPSPPVENGTLPARTPAAFAAALLSSEANGARIVLQTDVRATVPSPPPPPPPAAAAAGGVGAGVRRRRVAIDALTGDDSLFAVDRPADSLWIEGDSAAPCFDSQQAFGAAAVTNHATSTSGGGAAALPPALLDILAENPGRCRTLHAGGGVGRVFSVTATSITLKNLFVVGGGAAQGPGGCLQVKGLRRLVVENVVFVNCSSAADVRSFPLV